MRAETELKLNKIWYGDQAIPLGLKLLEPVYKMGNRVDRWINSRRRPEDLDSAFIIVVGNITAGGSGKTPVVIRLCKLLRQAGFRPGVISRGYGRNDNSLRLVSPASQPESVGDEPLLIAQMAGVPVIVSPNRCKAAHTLLKQDINVIISDDGLQHYRLPRTLGICLVDGSRGFGNGHMIPAGPLREPLERLGTFDSIVVNGESDLIPEELLPATQMTLEPGLLRSMNDNQSWRLAQFAGCKANAVAGVGNPSRYFNLLRNARINVIEHVFPDHHNYEVSDFAEMDQSLPILMTEKDAVKCRNLGLKNSWCLSVNAVLPSDWERDLVARVAQGTANVAEHS